MIDPRLKEAATDGDIDRFYELLGEDAFILEEVEKIPYADTPLHWAVKNGHTCFVEEITNLKPSFCLKLNQQGFSPLHLASSFGKLEIVKVLLNVDGSLCTLKGKKKMTPLHCAAIAGCIDVLKELLSTCPKSITALTVRKETALHLAVKNRQVEALKVLVNWTGRKHCYHGIVRWKDEDGNTVLHLAASSGRHEMIEVLLYANNSFLVRKAVQVNERNNEGLTAMDLFMRPPNEPDQERTRILGNVGAKKGQDIEGQQATAARSCVMKWLPKLSKSKHWFRYFSLKVDKDTPPETRNALLVVVVLIATATFQTGLNPPGGYWNEDFINDTNPNLDHYAGEPIWATYAPLTYNLVMLFNFTGFVLSLVLSYNLTQGYPLRGPLLLALILMLLTYSWSSTIFFDNKIYNGPAETDYSLKPANKMLWLPVVLVVIIWTTTANWMGQIWWKLVQIWRKFLRLTGRLSHD